METVSLAVIPGDGIGQEVIPAALRVVEAAARLGDRFRLSYREFPWSCAYYLQHGSMMPPDGLSILGDFPAILLGAVGFPTVPDHVSLWGLLLPIRQHFDQYVNLRPVRSLAGIAGRWAGPPGASIDLVVVRENTEGEYANVGGRLRPGTAQEVAMQTAVFTRFGTERIMRFAYGLAARRQGKLTAATKSNGLNYSMPFWDEVFQSLAGEYPQVQRELVHIDALAARFVERPQQLDVVVASNLFGDILSDLGAALVGGLGIAPSANLNPERRHPSMFEPVHGSAPDIAGRGIANPLGAIWAAQMLLEHLGWSEEAAAVMAGISAVSRNGPRTPDLGGTATTREVTEAVVAALPKG